MKKSNVKEFSCPECGYPMHCPCKSCKKHLPEGIKPWIYVKGEFIKCSNCGFVAHEDTWLDFEYDFMKNAGLIED